ncbi:MULTISPECIES: double-strand break repair protein AddB [Pacificimonas]|nr:MULTISPECIES: double-strand break repair protein AddB [Pacificimonas]MBZ6379465.1 double-strand break repair protein AddB [Pacificimonas aurantium]
MNEASGGPGAAGGRPRIFTVPPHGAFADRLVAGLMSGRALPLPGELGLARTTILLPNRRAVRAVRDAFVRHSRGALLLPRLAVLGDLDGELMPGLPADAAELETPPAISDLERTMRLMPLVERWQQRTGQARAKVETWRYAQALGRALDLIQLYGAQPEDLSGAVDADMAAHWQATARFLDIAVASWPDLLRAAGLSDRVEHRQALLGRTIEAWRASPPQTPIVAAGIANADPVAARLLGTIARLPAGAVVLPGLDLDMAREDWRALAPHDSHPQVPLKLLLDEMDAARGEVDIWPSESDLDGPAERSDLIGAALCRPDRTVSWGASQLRSPGGLTRVECRTPAEEAAAIALAMRRALDTPGKTAALVTPDRALARRVAVQMQRWGVEVDDSAGVPLSLTPPGAFLRLALEAAQSGFAPVPLMALLKHPLAGPGGEERTEWLRKVRRLDQFLRGVRPARGLQGVRNRITTSLERTYPCYEELVGWWKGLEGIFRPVAALFQRRRTGDVAEAAGVLSALVQALSDERFWQGQAGRAVSDLLEELERLGTEQLSGRVGASDLPTLVDAIAAGIAVRPLYGRHPRLAIYGLLEARLQRADLMILGGLNEGVWPPADAFDPWLPPKVRTALGLPPTDRALALSAHDFQQALGAAEVLVTRAARDETAPTVASRFWLRLDALLGNDWPVDEEIAALAASFDGSAERCAAARPAPSPPMQARPRQISVTQVETLRADPYQFYARELLGLRKLDALGEEAGPAERGTIVHDLLEQLCSDGGLHDPQRRSEAIATALKGYSDHPLLLALWAPRVERMLGWAADRMQEHEDRGWRIAAVERAGEMEIGGVTLKGKADVIFDTGGSYAVADYKTGQPPAPGRIREGYADQLALLAWMAEVGAFHDLDAREVSEIAYWKLSGGETEGQIMSSANPRIAADNVWRDLPAYFEEARARFRQTMARWLTGDEPFTARLRPEFAPYKDYEQLARVQEWEGNSRG